MVRRVSLASHALLGVLSLGAWGLSACGPSFQTIYEGDARFEHCYALEENPNVAMQQKGECWRDWLAHYTYGQTRDRVMYAHARAQAIRRAPQLPTDEAMMHAAPGEIERSTPEAMPAPTNAFTAPPKTWSDEDAGLPLSSPPLGLDPVSRPAVPVAPVSTERPPIAGCTDACDRSWSSCKASCKGDLCDGCAKAYKTCVRSCAK